MSTTINPPVLVGSDGSPTALAAIRWAAIDAARHRAPLHIVYAIAAPVDYGPGIAFPQFDYDSYRQEGRTALEIARKTAVAAASPIGELEISADLVEAPPIPVLRDRSGSARLLVVGTHGLGAFSRSILGSVSTSLARHAACPVAVIPAAFEHADGPVVVGVDGSPCSARAVEIAFDEAAHRGAELVAVHTWSEFFRYISRAQMQEEGEELLSESLAGYCEKYPEVPVRRIVVEDRSAKRLLDEGANAQLIVVGSHGGGGFAGMTLGSVSQAVLHGAKVPVIIARSAS
ncbi:universal stress protein [Nocardia abscessus]|uniref:universal stress protein n=1 Tax=Nocardia TaxID=1817 RepID=UPI00189396CE|nr:MULTISPECIES: universal stress protein [Nocardia]MBF6223073.1 universal stress protein [Nocardia abscessus]MDE1673889.1 universal stress protein [Nocardia gipuzkoensis]